MEIKRKLEKLLTRPSELPTNFFPPVFFLFLILFSAIPLSVLTFLTPSPSAPFA
jgi:hypothetical protein